VENLHARHVADTVEPSDLLAGFILAG
jgi:hypothetical protein